MSAYVANLVFLAEDSSEQAQAALQTLVRRVLRHVDEHVRTNRLNLLPGEETDAVAALGAAWKATDAARRGDRLRLVKYLARLLAVATPTLVFFHFDGDVPWGSRARSENAMKWNARVVEEILRFVGSRKAELDFDRLIPVTPYYSIEAWLFQATDRALSFCRGCHHEQIAAWSEDRARLDEEVRPKMLVCFGSERNADLAKEVPVVEVLAAGKSLAAFVEDLRNREPVRAALRASYAS